MSAPKHTPGPLTVRPADGRYKIVTATGELVGTAEGGNRDSDEANGRLFAAAAELLEALKAVLRDARFVGTDLSALRLANEAIAKAEGK